MSKRKTKQQREYEQRQALRRRVEDICAGATYGEAYQSDEYYHHTASELSRIVPACEKAFLCTEDGQHNNYLFRPHNLDHYENIDSITDFLFDHGVRA